MPQAAYDVAEADQPFARLPVTIDLKSSRVSGLIRLLLLVPALVILLVPLGVAGGVPGPLFSVAIDNPAAAAQVAARFPFATLLARRWFSRAVATSSALTARPFVFKTASLSCRRHRRAAYGRHGAWALQNAHGHRRVVMGNRGTHSA